jgi:hypothetical protein
MLSLFLIFLFFDVFAGSSQNNDKTHFRRRRRTEQRIFSLLLSLSLSLSLSLTLSIHRRRRITENAGGGARDPEQGESAFFLSFFVLSVEFEREERFPFTALKRRTRKEEVEGRWRNRLKRP